MKQYSVEPSRVYLVHDELDQPVGVSRVREGGSAKYVFLRNVGLGDNWMGSKNLLTLVFTGWLAGPGWGGGALGA